MWWLLISWLIGVGICIWTVNRLWIEGGDEMDQPWEKRE